MKKAAVLLTLVLLVMPAFSDGPKPSDPQPEFYFTRLGYTDFRGRGPSGDQSSNDLFRGLRDGPNGFFGLFGGRNVGSWMTDAWDADYKFM